MGALILMCGMGAIAFIGLFIILIPIVMEQMEDLAKDFWAARIAWQEGKEKYMEYIKSHK